MPDDNLYLVAYYRLIRDMSMILAAWPLSQEEKDDPQRQAMEVAAWRRFYDQQIGWRLEGIGRVPGGPWAGTVPWMPMQLVASEN